ncbi:UNVERIFIED_CONTAM: hypothetical protein GTU68_023483 [Idotea baltica]|nr:hypothetical protein [Idotea baltica]
MNLTAHSNELAKSIDSKIRKVPDFPKEGILFYDISPVLADASLRKAICLGFTKSLNSLREVPEAIVAIDARGFVFGTMLADELKLPLILCRKPGKLAPPVQKANYELEYGTNSLELQSSAELSGKSVVLVDDVVATGGTLGAASTLVRKVGGKLCACVSLIELKELGGRNVLKDTTLFSLLEY